MADIITIADAIVDALNAHAFSMSFTAERAYLPTYDLPKAETLKVTVVPKSDQGQLDSRSQSRHDYSIDIGIQKKPSAIDNTNLDPLMTLVQEIADYFLFGKAPGGATLVAPEIRILYFPEHLQQLRQFTAVVTLTFRGWRAAA